MRYFRVISSCYVGALCLFLASCQEDLYTKLTEREANEIVAILQKKGISASRTLSKDGSITVRVDQASFGAAVDILTSAGMPKTKFITMGDVFADNKLISSPTEERARFVFALSQELSKTLSEIDGVVSARVHIVLPKNDPLRQEDKPSSASVFIKHEPDASVRALLPQIKSLVSNSVEGLTYDKVSVVFVPAEKSRAPFPANDSEDKSAPDKALTFITTPRLIPGAYGLVLVAVLCISGVAWLLWRRFRAVAVEAVREVKASGNAQGGTDK